MRRNTLVLFSVLFLLAVFAWAGWANWEYRQQENEKRLADMAPEVELIPASAGGAATSQPVSPLQGKPAPNFTLEDLSGKKVSLANYKGKAVLINFWATWCGPCKLETPWLVELRNKYASQGFEVLGVDSEGDAAKPGSSTWDKDKTEVTKFITQQKVPYPVLLNGDSLATPYGGLDDLPESFYINKKGVVVIAQVGIDSEKLIEDNIKKTLAQ
jgi:cytochrome c biogenesis protein CcmG/thiol:disulfide interchange protein DsbE